MIFNEHSDEQTEKAVNQQVNCDTELNQQSENLRINLLLEDLEIVNTLLGYTEGRERDKFICAALKIGIQAFKNAQNNVDSASIENEIEKMLVKVADYQNQLVNNLTSTMSEYLDPEKGTLNQRIRRLIKQDDGEIAIACADALGNEFSSDNQDGVLKKLSEAIKNSNSVLAGDIKILMNDMSNDFSLDNDNSVLNRIIKNYEEKTENYKKEVTKILSTEAEKTTNFQANVMSQLEGMKARKEESYASTRHGHDFQSSVNKYIASTCQEAGDITEDTGSKQGKIQYSKVGDCVITLGPDAVASGAKIVVEMKEDKSYSLSKSLQEIEMAKKNREAQIGLFIHSKRTARDEIPLFKRYDNNIVLTWDAEDSQSDVWLDAALMTCKYMASKIGNSSEKCNTDITLMEDSIREIERQAKSLDEIEKSSNTIKNGAEKIINNVDKLRSAIKKEIAVLDNQVKSIREMIDTEK